jgi:protein-S-isoprenylcysteine O-methyltransferase Ste14
MLVRRRSFRLPPCQNPAVARPFDLVLGVAAYLAALGSMLWFAGFVGGIVVPKTVDSGRAGPPALALAVDLALLASFAGVHSLLARRPLKRTLARWLRQPLVRAVYSLIAAIQVALLCGLWRPLPGPVWSVHSPVGRLALWALFGLGWAIVLAALGALGSRRLFGLDQAAASAYGRELPAPTLTPRGIYRLVRHPLYVGTLIALWATPDLSVGHAVLAGGLTLYLVVGAQFEDRDLEAEHGEAFRRYRAATPGWLPRWPRTVAGGAVRPLGKEIE